LLIKRRLFLEELGKSLITNYIVSGTNLARTEEAQKIMKRFKNDADEIIPILLIQGKIEL